MIERKDYPSIVSIPLAKKLNPIWWFLNDDEPVPPDWYLPGGKFRMLRWYLRNPFQNCGKYVVGVEDRDHSAYGPAPLDVTTWWEVSTRAARAPVSGWKWSIIKIGWLRLPFVSFENAWIIAYAGWQPYGFFGLKFNLKTRFNLW